VQKQITIAGRSYTLRADDGEELEAAALELDRRMAEVRSRTPAFDPYTVALLAALNLASELRATRARVRQRLDEVDRHAAAVEAILQAAVELR
jgi:cell division protein ZapA (FtsZ GTPase activity inhibitor)